MLAAEFAQEVIDQGALADAGRTVHHGHHRSPLARGFERFTQRCQFALPAEKWRSRRVNGGVGGRSAQAEQDILPRGPRLWIAPQEVAAEPFQVLGNLGGKCGRLASLKLPFLGDHFAGRAGERVPPGECFKKDDPHRVPVRRFGREHPGALFR